jgi:hypothetical membrane protein
LWEQRKNNLQRSFAGCGIIAPVLAFTCILIAIATYPSFSWTNNALSDLGVVSGVTGPVFNFGLYVSGLLALNFAVFGLYNYLGRRWVGKAGALVFAAAGLALMGIGFAPENRVPFHYLFSVAFFVLLPIALLIITAVFAFERRARMAWFTLAVAVVAALPWILYFSVHYVPGVAIPEAVSGLAGSVWAEALGYKMIKAASQPKTA